MRYHQRGYSRNKDFLTHLSQRILLNTRSNAQFPADLYRVTPCLVILDRLDNLGLCEFCLLV